MPFKDPEKRRAYRRKWYRKNRKSEVKHVRNRKNELRKQVFEYKKSVCCKKCGESHPATIDFHHSKDDKESSISLMITNGHSFEKIKEELNKCVPLCANCHRKMHHKETTKNL